MEKFCEKCGTELIDGVCPKCIQSETKSESKNDGRFKKLFMSPDEKLVAVLGNSYVENFIRNGSFEKGFAVVSEKRVYFQGKNYSISHNAKGKTRVNKNLQSRVVDLKDVTGTGTDSYANVLWQILGYIGVVVFLFLLINIGDIRNSACLISMLFPIFCFFMYQLLKISLITIQYAGGEIGFDKEWFTQQEIDLFQKQVRLAKDKAIEADDNAVANKLQAAVADITQSALSPNSKASELTKLADLLDKGLITQEEFEKMKKELI